jgi:CRISPR-associated endonuclease Csy4
MDHYIEIQLNPDAEMRENVLLNLVYTKLNKALFDLQSVSIGVSFPDYQLMLGTRIRLHGLSDDLEKLQSSNWIGGLSGYCTMTLITKVPVGVSHRNISRKQSTMTQAKLNRLIKRGTITTDKLSEYKARMFAKGLDNPYLELVSGSNGHKHRRYIQFGELIAMPISGTFDQFGLSKHATVPWF